MNKNKAFTLVELIAVIAILSVILVMFVPSLLNSINENKTKALNKMYDLIETAARNYVMDYNISTPTKIELEDLCKTPYIECPIINPETEEELDGYIFAGKEYIYSTIEETYITVDLNGGTSSQNIEGTYEPGTVIELKTPTKNNEEFKGWKVVKGNSGIKDNKLIVGTTESIIWAEWDTQKLVKLTLDLDGGSLSNKPETEYLVGTNINIENPTKEGYTFTGWEVTEGNSVVSGSSLTIGNSDTVIKANWKVSTYTVTLNPNGGTVESTSIEVYYGDEYGNLPIPTKEGYTFTGWYTELNGVVRIESSTKVTLKENHNLYAGWLYSEFAYSGTEEEFKVPLSGYYELEVWGAQGGNSTYGSGTYVGGYGGYSRGVIYLEEGEILYINVGGKGQGVNVMTPDSGTGYNGGGYANAASNNSAHGGGGGATHIATESGILSSLSKYAKNHNSPILIVAGGGGGASTHASQPNYSGNGGHAGGYKGNNGNPASTTCYNYGEGGTQDTYGSYILCSNDGSNYTFATVSGFGYGANYNKFESNFNVVSGSGGGSGYYGGGFGGHGPGGGGSGYIGNTSLTDKAMYCYDCDESTGYLTKTVSTTKVSETPISNYAKIGNGYAKITYRGN